jgi:hypothetical protein
MDKYGNYTDNEYLDYRSGYNNSSSSGSSGGGKFLGGLGLICLLVYVAPGVLKSTGSYAIATFPFKHELHIVWMGIKILIGVYILYKIYRMLTRNWK